MGDGIKDYLLKFESIVNNDTRHVIFEKFNEKIDTNRMVEVITNEMSEMETNWKVYR